MANDPANAIFIIVAPCYIYPRPPLRCQARPLSPSEKKPSPGRVQFLRLDSNPPSVACVFPELLALRSPGRVLTASAATLMAE
jgi:hypothetical protein